MFYDTIARYYDAETEHFTDDLPLYLELAEETGAPILDVGCGTGRIALTLAQAGYAVVGVDSSAPMLGLAQRKLAVLPTVAPLVTLTQADILSFDQGRYPLILLAYNALMHFTDTNSQLALLRQLSGLVADEGRMVIDLPNAAEAYAAEDAGGVVLERTFTEPQSGNLVLQQSVSTLYRTDQLLHIHWIYDEILPDSTLKRTLAPQVLRYVFAAELRLLLQVAGWQVEAEWGDYDQSDFAEGCERLIILASKRL